MNQWHIPGIPVWQSIIINSIIGLGLLVFALHLWFTRNDNKTSQKQRSAK